MRSEPPQRAEVSEKLDTLAALCARELPVSQTELVAACTLEGVQQGWGKWCGYPRQQNPSRSKMRQKNEFL